MSTPIPPTGSGIAPQASTSVAAATGASGANSGNVSGGAGGTTGSIPSPPPSVAVLLQQVGSTVTGTLAARTPGQIVLNTPQGPVQVSTPTPLPASIQINTTLLLQVTDTGPPLQVLIQQPTGSGTGGGGNPAGTTTGVLLAAQQGSATASAAPTSAVKTSTPTLAGTPVTTTLTQGATIAATVSGASFTLPTAANPAPSPAGATAPLPPATAGATPSATAPAQSSTAGPPASSSAATPAAGTITANAPAAGPGALPKNAYLPVRVLALQLPTTGQIPLAASGPLSFIGTVTGATVDGQTIVSTQNGSLTLATRSAAPVGTQILLEAAGRATIPQSTSRVLPHGMTPTFEALRQAMDALQIAAPAATQTILQQLIPQPGPQMGISIVFLLQALRGGVLDRWLGQDGLRALKRAAGGSGPLEQEFSSLRGRAKDGAGADWRLFHLPLTTADDIEPLRLYLKDQPPDTDEDAEKEKPGQRFVIEANFTRLGPYQFDGLVRDKHLTLMIRTVEPVAQDMRADIQSLYNTALESLGLTGSVGYHVVKAFDLVPVGDDPSIRASGVTV